MKTRMFFTLAALGLALSMSGCVSRYQYEVDQSLLVQENQKLENALYVTHNQLVDMKRENERLKDRLDDASGTALAPARRPARERIDTSQFDTAPEYAPPKIEIPDNGGSQEVPDLLQTTPSSLVPPIGRSMVRTQPPPRVTSPQETTDSILSSPTFPTWNPTR